MDPITSLHCDIAGGYDRRTGAVDYILHFNQTTRSWTQVGQLQEARASHGVSVVNVEDIIDYCN